MICQFHFDEILAAISFYGIDHLGVTSSEERAALEAKLEKLPPAEKHGALSRETFDPIWYCSMFLVGDATRFLERRGKTVNDNKCVLCDVLRSCSCNSWSCALRKAPWVTDEAARNAAVRLGLAVAPTKTRVGLAVAPTKTRAPTSPATKKSPATELVGARKMVEAALEMDGLKPADASVEIATRPDGTRVVIVAEAGFAPPSSTKN